MVKYGGGIIRVCGIYSAYGVGPLMLIEAIMIGQRDKEILQDNLLQYASLNIGPNCVFQ